MEQIPSQTTSQDPTLNETHSTTSRSVEPMGSKSQPKKKKLAHETHLHRYRITVLAVTAGIAFLLGAGIMALVLNQIEDIILYGDDVKVNTRALKSDNTAFSYLTNYLQKERTDLPLFIGGQEANTVCTSIKAVQPLSIDEIRIGNNGETISDIYSTTDGYLASNSDTKAYLVEALVECENSQGSTTSTLASGRVQVSKSEQGYTVQTAENSAKDQPADAAGGTFPAGEVPEGLTDEELSAS